MLGKFGVLYIDFCDRRISWRDLNLENISRVFNFIAPMLNAILHQIQDELVKRLLHMSCMKICLVSRGYLTLSISFMNQNIWSKHYKGVHQKIYNLSSIFLFFSNSSI